MNFQSTTLNVIIKLLIVLSKVMVTTGYCTLMMLFCASRVPRKRANSPAACAFFSSTIFVVFSCLTQIFVDESSVLFYFGELRRGCTRSAK